MGEKSKKIGEIGENIVENFFQLIGWNNSLQGQNLNCKKPQKHARKDSKSQTRETHGIDFLYCYKSPLESSTIENIIISVKHTENAYETNPKTTFKKHVEDLVHTLECFKNSELKKQQLELFGRVKRNRDVGVLFWLSSNDNTYEDVIEKVSNIKLEPEWNFESLHVVDNKRIQFIYDTITFFKKESLIGNLNFYYPETSLSYVDQTIPRSGKICPVEFLTSPVLPLIVKAENTNQQDTFCLSTIEPFDQDSLRRLIKAAIEYTQDISCKYLFLFPNYTPSHHNEAVKKAATGFDKSLESRIDVKNYHANFRNLNNV